MTIPESKLNNVFIHIAENITKLSYKKVAKEYAAKKIEEQRYYGGASYY